MIHRVKGFGIVNKAGIDIFLELSCIFYDPADVGISQVKTLEWVAISFSRESSLPNDQTHVSCIDRQVLYH